MWTCPLCLQKFLKRNQPHSCNERQTGDFLQGKSSYSQFLFHHFIHELRKHGDFTLHPAKSRIAFAAKIRFGYIHRIGKDFLDVVFTFNQAYNDNLCFYRIGHVPNSSYYQHYLRIKGPEDINEEVTGFMKLAIRSGQKLS